MCLPEDRRQSKGRWIVQALAKPCIYLAILAAIVGGISRILALSLMGIPSRLFAGAAAILLLLAIAINTSPKS